MRCYPEQFYSPPEGLCDFPYIYSFDVAASNLTNGQPANNQRVTTDGDSEFLLRAVLGAQDVLATGARLQLYDVMQRGFFQNALVADRWAIWPVVPEKRWTRGGILQFDLSSVAGVGTAYAKLLFQGVKRFPAPQTNPQKSKYQWKDRAFDLTDAVNAVNAGGIAGVLTVNWAQGQPRLFKFPVPTYDFELQQILAVDMTTGLHLANQLAFRFFDPWPRPMMDSPIADQYLMGNCDGSSLTEKLVTAHAVPQCFPCPPVLYPANSLFQYEITPLTNTPVTLQLVFRGQRRIPC